MVSVAKKLCTTEEWRQVRIVGFGEEITGTKDKNQKTVLVQIPVKIFSVPWKLLTVEENR
jgi:hypothetical protein